MVVQNVLNILKINLNNKITRQGITELQHRVIYRGAEKALAGGSGG